MTTTRRLGIASFKSFPCFPAFTCCSSIIHAASIVRSLLAVVSDFDDAVESNSHSHKAEIRGLPDAPRSRVMCSGFLGLYEDTVLSILRNHVFAWFIFLFFSPTGASPPQKMSWMGDSGSFESRAKRRFGAQQLGGSKIEAADSAVLQQSSVTDLLRPLNTFSSKAQALFEGLDRGAQKS